jgi:hypothetical protein
MEQNLDSPISPKEAMEIFEIPAGIVRSTNHAILKNMKENNGQVSSVFTLESLIFSHNATSPLSDQVMLNRIESIYKSCGWNVTVARKQIERDEYVTELTFLGLAM